MDFSGRHLWEAFLANYVLPLRRIVPQINASTQGLVRRPFRVIRSSNESQIEV